MTGFDWREFDFDTAAATFSAEKTAPADQLAAVHDCICEAIRQGETWPDLQARIAARLSGARGPSHGEEAAT